MNVQPDNPKPIIVIGAGPAGLMAAIRAADLGVPVLLLEKMPSPGRKLLITGAGRCNITNSADMRQFIDQFHGQGRFLYPALQRFFRQELLDLLGEEGVPVITETTGKIFPASDQAGDVLNALLARAARAGVVLRTSQAVRSIQCQDGRVTGVRTDQADIPASAVILTTGGQSWPSTGSAGDGYRMAAHLGHHLIPLRPALVPFVIEQKWVQSLSGLSCPAVHAELLKNSTLTGQADGELLWTHFGLSGPVILRLSRNLIPDESANWEVRLDLRPDRKMPELLQDLQSALLAKPRQIMKNALEGENILPRALMQALLQACAMPPDLTAAQASKRQLEALARQIKQLTLTVSRTRGYREAMVTAGGVDLKEINPKTMASRLISGLYLAGEILDLDGDTGGYNLQAAFSTGYLAGECAAQSVLDGV